MNNLQDILYNAGGIEINGCIDRKIRGITMDSSLVKKGFIFVAIEGSRVDGHRFINDAVKRGAVAVVCLRFPKKTDRELTFIKVRNTAKALGVMASNFYDNPSVQLKLVGVTGTNGKTTVVTLLHKLFMGMGYKTGMLSTIVNKINNKKIKATHTTADAVSINTILRQMLEEGCDYVFMEVSSHALVQQRIAGLNFAGGVFTNITHDHLDYHKTFAGYLQAKKLFFDGLPKQAFALSNTDDKNGQVILQNTKARKTTYALKNVADFKGKVIENNFNGLQMEIDGNEFYSLLVGYFNAYNLLAVYAVARLFEMPSGEILTELSKTTGVEGRFDIVRSAEDIIAIIDYAHTPDALKNVLQTINEIRTGNEQLITVVGAGGDRDKSKRSEMADIASELSTKLILTSDNPRSEEPEAIIVDMKQGVAVVNRKKTLSITNRKEAITAAYHLAQPGDILLIAGKGHEKYQEAKGVCHHFDDKEVIIDLFDIK